MKTLLLGLLAVLSSHLSFGQASLYTFNGGGTIGDWDVAATWTTDPTGSTSINARVPSTGDNVLVTNSFVVLVKNPVAATGLNVTVQKGGVLDLTTSTNSLPSLASLGGQGTLRIAGPYFPTITNNNFDDANTGTVEFYNWPAAVNTLPRPATNQYNNLRLFNSTTAAYTAQLDNNLTLVGSLTLSRTNGAAVTLNLGQTASTNRILTVQGNITVGTGTLLGVTAVAGAHVLNVSGSFVNNGTVNLHNGTTDDTQAALLNFTGATNTNFACNGPTDLGRLQVDKGVNSQVLLNVTATVAPGGASASNLRLNYIADGALLILVNGVTKLGGNISLLRIQNGAIPGIGFNIGSSASSPTLWIAGASVYNNNATGVVVYGTYRISGGRFENITPDAMVIREDGQLLVEGGVTLVDKFRPSSTSSTHRGSFIMTGGLFEANGAYTGTSTVTPFARFAIPYLSQSFKMSGGTLRVTNPANCTGLFHIGINSNNAVVSGGTIEINLPSTTTNAPILATAPLWNLTIKKPAAGGTSKAILADITSQFTAGATNNAQPITVLNNFTLDATNPTTFDAAGFNVTIQGTLTIGTGCTYLPGANTTTFSGLQNQLLTNNGTIGATAGLGTFNNWTVDKAGGTLTLAGSVVTYYTPTGTTLAILKGVLNDAGKAINVQGSIVNSAFHQSAGGGYIAMNGAAAQTIGGDGTGVFGNLRINSTLATAGAVAVTLAANISVSNLLTLQSQHVLAIGAYRLALTNVSTTAITGGALSNLRMIQTAGNASDLGLQKTYGGNQAFLFPVGTGSKYTPATINLTLATSLSKYGQVSVSPANIRNPFATGTTNALNYFWKVRSNGFGAIPNNAINMTFTMLNADGAGNRTAYVGGRYLPNAWTKYDGSDGSGSGVLDSPPTSDITINNLAQFEGEFTAGETATAFGAVTAYYSMRSGNWTDTNLATTPWSTTGPTGPAVTTTPGAGNPVFIGSAGTGAFHTVTVIASTAKSGSLVIDRGSTLDIGTTTGHNFGELPDSKVGGSGRLRISSSTATATFPGGDFGTFIQYGGGTVEYYTKGISFTLPTTSGALTLNQYRNLYLSAQSGTPLTITLPNQDLRIYAQLKAGTPVTVFNNANGTLATGTTTTSASDGKGTVLLSAAAAGNLRVDSLLAVQGGVLRLQNTTARTLAVDTDVQVDAGATFDVANTAVVANALTVGGSLTNNGTLDFNVGTGSAGLTFTGSAAANLTGTTGTLTDLYALTVNKGTGRAATLNVDVAGSLTTPLNGWLTLTNGTLRFAKTNGNLTIHDGVATPYLITNNAGLTVDATGATVSVATNNNAAADLKLAGLVQVLQGTLSVGASGNAGNDLEYASAGAPGLKVSGTARLYVNGQIRRTVNNLDGSLRFDQSGGTIDIDGQGATAAQSNERGLFEVQGVGSIFRMSAGILNLHRSNQKSPIITTDLYLAPDSTVVTGGTIVLGNPTTATIGSNVTISVSSTVPLYDLRIESGANATNTNTGLLAGVIPLTLKGSLTIGNDFSFFNANGLGLNISQRLANNNTSASTALNAGGFQPITPTQTTTFVGGIPTQLLTGTAANLTVFGSLTVNNPQASGTLQLGGNALVAGTLTLTKGTLDDNGKTITALGDVLNSTAHLSGGPGTGSLILAGSTNQNIGGNGTGRFGNVNLNNAVGATATTNQEITKVLTLTNGVLFIGSNLLYLSNPAATAMAGTFDNSRCIRTNGIVADLGVRKSYPAGASNFTFPIGAAVVTKYTPVQMNVTASSTAGTITVQPIDIPHPSTTDPANKELSYYWKVSSTGLTSPVLTQVFAYAASDVNGTEASYKLGRFLNGQWTPPLTGIATSLVNTTAHTLTNPGVAYIDGDYTGGEVSEFGAVPTFYSRNTTAGVPAGAAYRLASSWTFNADGTDSGPLPAVAPTLANPVVIRSGHLINATAPVNSNASSLGAATLQLLGTLDLGPYAANNFNTVSGTGTLRIGSALFPAGNYANFVAANTGTVDFTAAVQLPARDTYNNLNLSGSNGKQLTNLDLTINGTLSVAAGTTVDNPTSQNITLTSATGGATVAGTFNLNDGKLATGAFLAATGAGSKVTLGAGTVSVGTYLTNSGTINQGNGALTVGTSFANTGTYNATTGTGDLAVGTTFANNGTYNAGVGNLNVSGSLTNALGASFATGTGTVNAGGNFSNAGTYGGFANPDAPYIMRVNGDFSNLASGQFNAQTSNIVLRGNFSNASGTGFSAGTSLVQFITDINRFITGTTSFYNLQKLGSSALTLGASTDATVAGLLTIQNSIIFTGTGSNTNTLYLTNTLTQPIVGNTLTAYVVGRLAMSLPNEAASIRVFPVGAGSRYRPVTIKPLGTSASPVVLVEIINGPPAGTVDATLSNLSANRYYRIQLLSGTIVQPTVQLSFNTDVTDEEVHVPGNLRVARATGTTAGAITSPWSTAGGSGVYSPEYPRGYTTSAATTVDGTSFFALASTNKVDNPLTGSSPLPVELLQFGAVRQGAGVRVAWATASEKNSDYFVVERSDNGRTFAALERQPAQGNSTARHDYATFDAAPLAGISYYRLRQVDRDGKTAYSNVALVRFEGQTGAPVLVAYPNPTSGNGFQLLASNLGGGGGTVRVFDSIGRLVQAQAVAPNLSTATVQPTRPLTSGMYFVTWTTTDGLRLTTKVAGVLPPAPAAGRHSQAPSFMMRCLGGWPLGWKCCVHARRARTYQCCPPALPPPN